ERTVSGARPRRAARGGPPPRALVFTSSAAVYPRDGGPFREEHAPGPLDTYGHTKLSGEDLVRLFGREAGVRVVVARLFNAFGPDDTNPHLVPEVVRQLRGGARALRLGNLDPVRDYVHVRDVAAALPALADAGAGGVRPTTWARPAGTPYARSWPPSRRCWPGRSPSTRTPSASARWRGWSSCRTRARSGRASAGRRGWDSWTGCASSWAGSRPS